MQYFLSYLKVFHIAFVFPKAESELKHKGIFKKES